MEDDMNLPVPVSPQALDRVFRQQLPRYFTMDEVNAILSANVSDPRAYVIVNTLWKTGLRCSELIGLKRQDLDPLNKTLRVVTLKRGLKHKRYTGTGRPPTRTTRTQRLAERIVPIPDDLVASFLTWLHHREAEELIFPFSRVTVFRIVEGACRKAGFSDGRGHPHTFRHSYAVHMLLQGVPVTILRELLGHSNISSTLVYLRITQPDKRAILDKVRWV
jgi:integrase